MKSEDIIKIENLKNKNKFTITWNVTYLCNYYCDFCIQGNKEKHIEKSKGESIEIRRKICDNLVEFIETKLNHKYKFIDVFLVGGEITILKDFIEIIEKIAECKFEGTIRIQITTNLSAEEQVLRKLVKIARKKRKYKRIFRISASYYKEFAKEEEFIKKVKILAKNENLLPRIEAKLTKKGDIGAYINYPLCTDEDYELYLKFKEKYKKQLKKINYIIIKNYKISISDKVKKKLLNMDSGNSPNIKVTFKNNEAYYCTNNNKITLKLDSEAHFNPKGYMCDAGIYSISINNLGIVSRCKCCKKQTIIGDMKENIINLPTEELECPVNECGCSYYRKIEKS